MKKYYFDSTDSTNSEAKRLIKSGASEDFAVIANCQRSGRGQFNRAFFSPADTGIYLSVALKLSTAPDNSFMTRAAAVAVCRSIKKLYSLDINIKPINDLFYNGKKLGGILVESFANFGCREYFAVFGIGINLCKPAQGFPKELERSAVYLFEERIQKDGLIAEIIERLCGMSCNFNDSAIVNEYENRKTIEE